MLVEVPGKKDTRLLRRRLLAVPALRQRGVQLALHGMRGCQRSGRQVPVVEACGSARLR